VFPTINPLARFRAPMRVSEPRGLSGFISTVSGLSFNMRRIAFQAVLRQTARRLKVEANCS
jgi:hypothetical protein